MQEFWFRYVDRHYAAMLDEFERPMGRGRSAIELLSFPVAKHTPKGVWLHLGGGQKPLCAEGCTKALRLPEYRGSTHELHRAEEEAGKDFDDAARNR
jgi:hypothetical protein